MVAVEVLTAVVVLALAIVTTAAFYVGVLGALGLIRYVRCDRCGHLGLTSASEPLRSCLHCRHGQLFHPHFALHHARAEHGSDRLGSVGGRGDTSWKNSVT